MKNELNSNGFQSLSINPSNQGLKHDSHLCAALLASVSIHQSIKSRVETCTALHTSRNALWSLSINPSNQGLKPPSVTLSPVVNMGSLSINPSNQGLKLASRRCTTVYLCPSLSINPSNQGLKLCIVYPLLTAILGLYPSIHQIKGWNPWTRTAKPFSGNSLYPSIHQIKGWNNPAKLRSRA